MSLNEKLLGWLFANNHPLQIFAAIVGDPSKSSETISPLLTSYYGKKKLQKPTTSLNTNNETSEKNFKKFSLQLQLKEQYTIYRNKLNQR